MTCDEIRLLLADYGAGRLESTEASVVRAHLAACAGCREAERQEAALTQMLRRAAMIGSPPNVMKCRGSAVRRFGRVAGGIAAGLLLFLAVGVLLDGTASVVEHTEASPRVDRSALRDEPREVAPTPAPFAETVDASTERVGESGAYRLLPGVYGDHIVRAAAITIVAPDSQGALSQVIDLCLEVEGRVIQSRTNRGADRELRVYAALRVPSERLEQVMSQLQQLGDLQSQEITAIDIEAVVVDFEGRLAAARTLRDRLVAALEEHRGTVAQVLEIEREIARVEREIETFGGQLQSHERSVAEATVTVEILPSVEEPAPEGRMGIIGDGVDVAMTVFAYVLSGMVAILAAAFPIAVVGIPAWLILRRKA